jgi:hypothetical protein
MTGTERKAMIEAMRIGTEHGALGETVWFAARDFYAPAALAAREEPQKGAIVDELIGAGREDTERPDEQLREFVLTPGQSDSRADHAGHRIEVRTPDMAGRPVVICVTCNARLRDV